MRYSSAYITLTAASIGVVPVTDVYPMVEYWHAGDFRANPLCEMGIDTTSVPQPTIKASKYPFRKHVGTKEVATELMGIYETQNYRNLPTQDVAYSAIMRRKTQDHLKILNTAVAGVVVAERNEQTGHSFSEEVCRYFDAGLTAKAFCWLVGNFTQATKCISNYEYQDPVAVLADLAPENDFGFSLSDTCLQPLTAGRPTLAFELQQHGNTPDVIPNSVVQAEMRSYFLAWKALDHVNRYAEYVYLNEVTKRENGDMSSAGKPLSLADLSEDSIIFDEVLPEWKVHHVYYTSEPKFKGGYTLRVPLAVMATRNRGVMIILREAIDTYDGRFELYYQHTMHHMYNFTGAAHSGGASIYKSLTSTISYRVKNFYKQILEDIAAAETTESSSTESDDQEPQTVFDESALTPTITVIGSGQPMSTAAVLLADQLNEHVRGSFPNTFGIGFKVSSITFGTPYISDTAFATKIRRLFETRHITLGGGTDLAPCPVSYSCDERDLQARTGFVTGAKFNYKAIPGLVKLDRAVMTKMESAWLDETFPLQISALDVCGIPCALASQICPADDAIKYCNKSTCEAFV